MGFYFQQSFHKKVSFPEQLINNFIVSERSCSEDVFLCFPASDVFLCKFQFITLLFYFIAFGKSLWGGPILLSKDNIAAVDDRSPKVHFRVSNFSMRNVKTTSDFFIFNYLLYFLLSFAQELRLFLSQNRRVAIPQLQSFGAEIFPPTPGENALVPLHGIAGCESDKKFFGRLAQIRFCSWLYT